MKEKAIAPNSIKLKDIRKDFLMQIIVDFNNKIINFLKSEKISLADINTSESRDVNNLLGMSQTICMFFDINSLDEVSESTTFEEQIDLMHELKYNYHVFNKMMRDMNSQDAEKLLKNMGLSSNNPEIL